MTNYRRLRLPGATYFFTLCLQERGGTTLTDNIACLREAYRKTIAERPVTCPAIVILPDHLHAIWTEPADCVQFSERWRRIKARFSHALCDQFDPCDSKRRKRERGLWQRRFWEHAIRSEKDFIAAMDYCRTNPVRHGLVEEPEHWPYSSFTRRMGNTAHPTS
ncbi:transposase [Frigidibacter sp. SD6-1]|uniref:REP-associated tyrosine transposase n=1 Tax=Frigidibacter sp. SD6-1 TaxID=3032581 RepID=UPI0024DF65B1|nr:transposase [Frigidibacter sp. SD6-1]